VSCSAHVKIASRIVPYRKRCAMIPVAGQLTHGPTFRMLEVTLQQRGRSLRSMSGVSLTGCRDGRGDGRYSVEA